MMQICEHKRFRTDARIVRLTDTDGGPVTGYSAEIKIRCTECDTPFKFIGVPGGLSPNAPACSFDEQELRAPIAPVAPQAEAQA